MPVVLPLCPHLPVPRDLLDWRSLHIFRNANRGPEFYLACLEYGNFLWQRGQAARAMLCLDRAFSADLSGDEPALAQWPVPYAGMAWILRWTPQDLFIGNPRVHFQHYADRMTEPRRAQRVWRAWACWGLTRVLRPEFPADPRHQVDEPPFEEIESCLRAYGHPGEAELWLDIVARERG